MTEFTKKKCFVAYPSLPEDLSETIENFIYRVQLDGIVDIKGWRSLFISGKLLINEILTEIDSCDLFICDLTNLNHNVLFELGYAVSKRCNIWLILDETKKGSVQRYKKFNLINSLGYYKYANTQDLLSEFYKEQPYNESANCVLSNEIMQYNDANKKPSIFFLKSPIQSNAAIALSNAISNSTLESKVDDQNEIIENQLAWFVDKIQQSSVVISHLLSQTQEDHLLHNEKCSFISGMSLGLGNKTLLIAHAPFIVPFDYQDFLKTHKTEKECVDIINAFLNIIENDERLWEKYNFDTKITKELLKAINVGDPLAENESNELVNYFVETAEYNNAKKNKYSIIIGRKGDGKTALFYKLHSDYSKDIRNHICVIKPSEYDFNQLEKIVTECYKKYSSTNMIESIWKFIIYSEILKSIYDYLKNVKKRKFISEDEEAFLEICESRYDFINDNMAKRLSKVLSKVETQLLDPLDNTDMESLSAIFHDEILKEFREQIGNILNSRNEVVLLIDDLDKRWSKYTDVNTLSAILFSLLRASKHIYRDLSTHDIKRIDLQFSLILFLRSDIFKHIISDAREKDKIIYDTISWFDEDLLFRVLNERIYYSTSKDWEICFCKKVNGIPIREFIISVIQPKPRDLLLFVKNALYRAINHKHTIVEEEDVLAALKSYSEHAFNTVQAETSINPQLSEILYCFIGANSQFSESELRQIFNENEVKNIDYNQVVDILCDSCFLGRETSIGEYTFNYEENDVEIIKRKAENVKKQRNEFKYMIHPAFHTHLAINTTTNINH